MRLCWMCVLLAASWSPVAEARQSAAAPAEPAPSPAALAQEAKRPDRLKLGLIWENDADYYTFFDTEDANYTNGLRLDVAWNPEFAERWAKSLLLADQFKDMRSAFGLALGQNMYSPDAIEDPTPPPDEHPWGAWLYLGLYLQRADATRLDTLELDVGVTGEWAGGEPAQKTVHRVIGSPNPKGWPEQNEDEPGINLLLQRTWKVGWGEQRSWRAELLPYAGATLGTIFTNASGGTTARFGWSMPEDFGMQRIDRLGDQTAIPADGFGFYVFGRLGGKTVAHNTFLDGSLFQDGPTVDKEPLVGKAQVGVALRVCRGLEINYSQTWWTEEFETEGRGQHFGSWGVSVYFEY